MHILKTLLASLVLSSTAVAGPWLDPGDSGLRHDIQVLADAGVITAPVSTWPLSWADLKFSMTTHGIDLTPDESAALVRFENKFAYARRSHELFVRGHVSAAEHPRKIRTFDDGPREKGEVGAGIEWTGNRFAVRLRAQRVNDPDDGKDWRADGSYLGVALGNWMLAASTSDRYWGPGWQSSMILSNNARPIPSFTLERNRTTPFGTKWLSWLGPWDATAMWGYLDDDREISDARVFATRFNFRPRRSLEIGLSLMGLWCGSGQGCGGDDFFDLVTGSGGTGEFDRLAGMDVRWSSKVFGRPFALYTHWVGEDFGDGATRLLIPNKLFAQLGAEIWGYWERYGSYRFFLEWADTQCNSSLYRKLTNDDSGGREGCAYRNGRYKSGETYRGRSFAHSLDQDSSVVTFGGILNDRKDNSWLATAATGNLNEHGAHVSTVVENKTRYAEIEISHRRKAWVGKLNLGLGFEYREDRVTDKEDTNVRAFLEWGFQY